MKKLLTLVGIVATLVPMTTLAAYMSAGPNASLPRDVSGQNVYLAGGTVTVQSPVQGDVLAAGGTVIISSNVSNDIMAAGGTIVVSGASAEDARIAGGTITLGANLSGEAMIAGGQVTVTADTKIAKDSSIAAGTLFFAGTEAGSLKISGGDVHVDGTVNGNLTIKRAGKVSFGSHAVVRGILEYSAPQEAEVAPGAQIGQTVFHKIDARKAPKGMGRTFAGLLALWALTKLAITLTAAYLLWHFRKNDMGAVIQRVHGKFWNELLRGFGVLFLMPIAAIILFATVIGSIPAGILLLVYGVLLVLAAPVSFIVAASVLQKLFKKNLIELRWYHVLLGGVALSIVAAVPFIGWILCFALYLATLGATANALKARF